MSAVDTTSDNAANKAKLDAAAEVAHWLNELAAARKREKEFRKEGDRILEIACGEKKAETPFNILYSNTEVMLPSLYSAVPRPVVQRRFKDEDPLGKLAASAGQRGLEFLLDTNVDGYETFDHAMRSATLDGLLPGRGVTAVKYEAEVVDVPDEQEDGEEPPAEPQSTPVKNWESICPDSIAWDRFLHGYAHKWSKVPWISYELHLDEEEAEKAGIPEDVLAKIQFTEGEDAEAEDGANRSEDDKNTGERKTALFYQVWDKFGGRKVRYVCPQYKENFCLVQDDPLGLTGFFNCPRPIQFLEKTNDLVPIALYALYENQAEELNNLSRRIKRITAAIKAKGLYDTELGEDIKKLLEEDEPALSPADKSSSLAAEKGLDNAIWFWPVDKLIVVLRELYSAREQCKLVIYEIMGIADIMRGTSNASETLGAQEIKTQWGSLRLKRLQKEVQRYARDMLRMMLEVAAKKFSERTWAQMTGLPFVTTEQRAQLEQVAQAIQAQFAQLNATGTAPTPQLQQQAQQVQAEMQKPVWDKVLGMLRDDMQRAYRIDIETNSTVEPEATEDQKNIAEVMNALAQYLNGIAPLVVNGSMPFEAAMAMLLAIVRRFRFGPEIEDYIKAMKPPTPPDDGKAAEAAKVKAEQQAKAAELAQTERVEMAKHQREKEAEQNAKDIELARLASQNAIAQAQSQAEVQREAQRLEAERRAKQAELASERSTAEMKARIEQETELKKAAMQGAVQIEVARIAGEAKARDAAQKAEEATRTEQAEAKGAEASNATMSRILENQDKLLALASAPREMQIKREGGKVVGGRSEVVA